VTALDELNALLFVAKQQLRQFEEAAEDARKSARMPGAEIPPEIYLAVAAGLDVQAAGKREEIAELEKARAELP
jgi:hypothetical protein